VIRRAADDPQELHSPFHRRRDTRRLRA